MTPAAPSWSRGVRIAGSGLYLPERVLTNRDLESMMDTSDEWIVQRTGIRERRMVGADEGTADIAAHALRAALDDAGRAVTDLDMVVIATVCPDMPCPSTACQVIDKLGGGPVAAFDITAACSGFVYALNLAETMVRAGHQHRVGIVGAEVLSRWMDYSTQGRSTAILFGDAAGAVVIEAADDPRLGCIAQVMRAKGEAWRDLYMPHCRANFPEGDYEPHKEGVMQMEGRRIFKFAVGTFADLIQECLDKAGLRPEDVDQFICHQSNVRILDAARERFGLPQDKLYVNIDRYGNTSAASVPLCLRELMDQGKVGPGQKIMFVAFGGGLTWTASLWQL